MSKHVVSLKNVDSIQNIMKALKTKHHTFPLLNIHGNIVGLIPRNFILILIRNKAFYKDTSSDVVDDNKFSMMGVNDMRRSQYNINAKKRMSKQISINNNYSISNKIAEENTMRKDTIAEYTDLFDSDKYAETPVSEVLDWIHFTRDFESIDIEYDDYLKSICETNKDKMIDFRPYCISNPFVVMTTDYILKACELFRKMHLR